MELLYVYILTRNPAAVVKIIKSWPEQTGADLEERIKGRIPPSDPQNTYLLFDNAQDTYWDSDLWEYYFKDKVQRGSGPFAILFCSYGSPTYRPVLYARGAPLVIEACARMSLQPAICTHPRHSPVGLLFSREEFNEAIDRYKGPDRDAVRMDEELRELLFVWTMGHPGAVADLLFMLAHEARCSVASLLNSSSLLTFTETQTITRR